MEMSAGRAAGGRGFVLFGEVRVSSTRPTHFSYCARYPDKGGWLLSIAVGFEEHGSYIMNLMTGGWLHAKIGIRRGNDSVSAGKFLGLSEERTSYGSSPVLNFVEEF